ncbi:hypothetical protein CUMW_151070 [Citrus unshiu]|uniref:Uncharacterized protein n=2 Tax=Citrus TaxID=2706 RepID=A0A067DFT6_CITSI|nr:hypothetical protein CISIN_1g035123mg [Citrus sinensis]GAY53698.1 hypothetical protein CUMW_151070 [Citrus unshiu]
MVSKNHFLFASMALLIVIGLLITSEVTAARELGGTPKSKPCNYNMTRGHARELGTSDDPQGHNNYPFNHGRR